MLYKDVKLSKAAALKALEGVVRKVITPGTMWAGHSPVSIHREVLESSVHGAPSKVYFNIGPILDAGRRKWTRKALKEKGATEIKTSGNYMSFNVADMDCGLYYSE
jgi:hypothetical protein